MYPMQNNKSCKQDKHIHTPSALVGGRARLRYRGLTNFADLFIQHSVSIATSTLFTMVTLSCQQVTLRPRPPAVAVMKTVMRMVKLHFFDPWPHKVKDSSPCKCVTDIRGCMYFAEVKCTFFFFYLKLSILVVAVLFGYWSSIGLAVVCLWSSCLWFVGPVEPWLHQGCLLPTSQLIGQIKLWHTIGHGFGLVLPYYNKAPP